jgi:hypothetical protein
MDKVLILYSNPSDTARIRLDKEHRAVEQVVNALKLQADTVVRRHATTFDDFVRALAEADYSVVQFSSHGSAEGIFLEASSTDRGELITADRIANLLARTQPTLRLAIFMSCFSSASLPDLIKAAPYILTVSGPADDSTSIEFVKVFYERLLHEHSIEGACFWAQEMTSGNLQAILSRRALSETDRRVLFKVFPRGNHLGDSFLVDISQAEKDIESLQIPRDTFLSMLTRKIHLHNRIFEFPRERAILPIGPYFGIFSWQNPSDIITCHQILRVRPEVDDLACEVWAALAVGYNDDAMQRYRLLPEPAAPQNENSLKIALRNYRSSYEYLTKNEKYITVLRKYVPEQYKLSKSLMIANLDMADTKIIQEDLPSVVFYLESTLSAMHDLLDALTTELALTTH